MKLITLNLFALLILATSCNSTKKEDTTTQEDVTPEMEITYDAVSIEDTKWKLVELLGQDVSNEDAYIIFSTEEERAYGKGGCNTFSGTYDLSEGLGLKLSEMAITKMACKDVTIENDFMNVLNKVDNYSFNEENNTMTINKAKMAPLAKFEAVKE